MLFRSVVLGFNRAVNAERQAPCAQALQVASTAPDQFFVRTNPRPIRDPVGAMAILEHGFHDVRKTVG